MMGFITLDINPISFEMLSNRIPSNQVIYQNAYIFQGLKAYKKEIKKRFRLHIVIQHVKEYVW